MAKLRDLTELKAKVDAATQEKDRAIGAQQQIMRRLDKEFGCQSIEDAEAKLADLESKASVAEKAFDRALKKFQDAYGDAKDE